jgi:hypothetical protein
MIDECQQVFNTMPIRRSLYGLRKMSSDVWEVNDVLAALASRSFKAYKHAEVPTYITTLVTT